MTPSRENANTRTNRRRTAVLHQMTEAEAVDAGLTVGDAADLLTMRETPDETAERGSRQADELAAVVEGMLSAGRVTKAGLEVLRDSLGELHVELDMLAHTLRGAHPLGGAA